MYPVVSSCQPAYGIERNALDTPHSMEIECFRSRGFPSFSCLVIIYSQVEIKPTDKLIISADPDKCCTHQFDGQPKTFKKIVKERLLLLILIIMFNF
jgi:hypothetical protein